MPPVPSATTCAITTWHVWAVTLCQPLFYPCLRSSAARRERWTHVYSVRRADVSDQIENEEQLLGLQQDKFDNGHNEDGLQVRAVVFVVPVVAIVHLTASVE